MNSCGQWGIQTVVVISSGRLLFFLHSTVIGQFLTLAASSTTVTAHCRPRIIFESDLKSNLV